MLFLKPSLNYFNTVSVKYSILHYTSFNKYILYDIFLEHLFIFNCDLGLKLANKLSFLLNALLLLTHYLKKN